MEVIKCFVVHKCSLWTLALKGSAIDLPVHILFDMAGMCNVSWIAQFLTQLHLSKCSLDMDAPELESQASKIDNIFEAVGFGAARWQSTQCCHVRKHVDSPNLEFKGFFFVSFYLVFNVSMDTNSFGLCGKGRQCKWGLLHYVFSNPTNITWTHHIWARGSIFQEERRQRAKIPLDKYWVCLGTCCFDILSRESDGFDQCYNENNLKHILHCIAGLC